MLAVFLCIVLVTSEIGLTRTSPIDGALRKPKNDFIDTKCNCTDYEKDIKSTEHTNNEDISLNYITEEMTEILEELEPAHSNCPKTTQQRHHEHKNPKMSFQPYFQYTSLTKTITVAKMFGAPIDTGAKSNGAIDNDQTKQNEPEETNTTLVTASEERFDTTTHMVEDTTTEEILNTTAEEILNTTVKVILETTTNNNNQQTTTTPVSKLSTTTESKVTEGSPPGPNVAMVNCTPESGYTYFPNTGSCYKPFYEHLTWDQAHSKCLLEDANLLVINNEFENEVIKSIIKRHLLPQHPYFLWFWVGITRDENDVYHSVHSEDMANIYNVWLYKHNKQCVAVHQSGKLEDAPCDYAYSFICEKSFGLVIKIDEFE